jgi:exodeoxyribonuclease VII small subunit
MAKKKNLISSLRLAFHELEGIAHWFERGEPDLEQGLQKFTRASELAKALRERLVEVENVIKEVNS